ncbi:hypothetical protein EW785_19150 [Salmonella enterica]|nr:hypothetical protein [Salmonella enterica]
MISSRWVWFTSSDLAITIVSPPFWRAFLFFRHCSKKRTHCFSRGSVRKPASERLTRLEVLTLHTRHAA